MWLSSFKRSEFKKRRVSDNESIHSRSTFYCDVPEEGDRESGYQRSGGSSQRSITDSADDEEEKVEIVSGRRGKLKPVSQFLSTSFDKIQMAILQIHYWDEGYRESSMNHELTLLVFQVRTKSPTSYGLSARVNSGGSSSNTGTMRQIRESSRDGKETIICANKNYAKIPSKL